MPRKLLSSKDQSPTKNPTRKVLIENENGNILDSVVAPLSMTDDEVREMWMRKRMDEMKKKKKEKKKPFVPLMPACMEARTYSEMALKHFAGMRCIVQPKLDGCHVRIFVGEEIVVFTRGGVCKSKWMDTRYLFSDIARHVAHNHVFEGEFYSPTLKLNKVSAFLSRKLDVGLMDPDNDMMFTLFDLVNLERPQEPYFERLKKLEAAVEAATKLGALATRRNKITVIESQHIKAASRIELHQFITGVFNNKVAQGHEGVVVRNPFGVYECKRSGNLLKWKQHEDAEFEVVEVLKCTDTGVELNCRTDEGNEFHVMWYHTDGAPTTQSANIKGLMATVLYTRLTDRGIPREARVKMVHFDCLRLRKTEPI
jgi:ATP-dependent DNA ligase